MGMDNHQIRTHGQPYSLRKEASLPLAQRIAALTTEMQRCTSENLAINLSTPPHREIVEALHTMVYRQDSTPAEMKIIYNDVPPDQIKKKFPVYRFAKPSVFPDFRNDNIRKKAVSIGTLTFRHVVYDYFVDYYLIRDRETRNMNSLEIQTLAYRQMTEILEDPIMKDEAYIVLYETGLEPLVVGVYWALVDHLELRREKGCPLFVQPVFFADRNSRSLGKIWGRE